MIEIKTGTRVDKNKQIYTCEIWVDGIRYSTDALTEIDAINLTYSTAKALSGIHLLRGVTGAHHFKSVVP